MLDESAGTRLVQVLAGCGEDQVAIRPAGILGRRLTRAARPYGGQPRTPRGTVLITGGTGAIGGRVARWAAERGAPRVALVSRSGPGAPAVAGLAARLASAGTPVEVVACDVAVRAQVAELLARIGASGPAVSGVVHAAGVVDDGVLDRLDTGRLAAVADAKTAGAVVLDELTAELRPEVFVLFSSVAAVFGGAGQGNYAAANAALDALAGRRRARGLAATSVAWGPWAGGGMAQGSEAARARVRRGALPALDPDLAVRALGEAVDGGDGVLAVMDVDWAQFAAAPGVAQLPLVRDLPEVREHAAAPGTQAGQEDGLAGRLAGLPRAEQLQLLAELVRAEAAAILGHASAEAIDLGQAFKDLGFDSLTAVELRNRLAAVTGLRLSATLVFDYATPAALADHLRAVLADEGAPTPLPLLAELDKLESMLAGLTADEAESATITARLEAVTSKWKEARRKLDKAAVTEQLEASTDDEIFDFIGKELGIS